MSKIKSLESLRGFAALVVAFYHLPSSSFFYIGLGHFAVYFFFCLSGFVITLNYFDRIDNFKSLFAYQKKRFFRLYPVHLFVLIVVLTIQIIKLIILNFTDLEFSQKAFQPDHWFSIKDFIQHLFLLQSVTNFGYHLSWNGSAWTISTEFYTYFVFGLIVLLTKRNKFIFILFCILFVLFNGYLNFFVLNSLFIECVVFFLLGSLVFFLYEKIKLRFNDLTFIVLLILVFLFNSHLSDLLNFLFKSRTTFVNHILFSSIILLVVLLKENSVINKVLNFKPFVFFGTISYSFYMIHSSILYLFKQFLKIVEIRFMEFYALDDFKYNFVSDLSFTFLYILLSTSAAVLMYYCLENKYRIK